MEGEEITKDKIDGQKVRQIPTEQWFKGWRERELGSILIPRRPMGALGYYLMTHFRTGVREIEEAKVMG